MTDLQFLRTAITEVLPDLSESVKEILEETLGWGLDDFQYIEEADLLPALKPIQAQNSLAVLKLRCKSSIIVQVATCVKSCLHKDQLVI